MPEPSQEPPAANIVPPEILLQIYCMLSPRDFENARKTCSQWMRISLDPTLLESMLKRAGWWDAWQRDRQISRLSPSEPEESLVWRMSKRFATECLLSGRKTNVERAGFLTTSIVDFSNLSNGLPASKNRGSFSHAHATVSLEEHESHGMSKFNVSTCGNYLLVTSGSMIYIYRLLSRQVGDSVPVSINALGDLDFAPICSIACPAAILSVTIDTTAPKFVVAALLQGRVGMICDIDPTCPRAAESIARQSSDQESLHFYRDICSPDDPPHSVSICPGRRCVAFGCGNGIELHWVDEKTRQDCRKHFPMSQPSEILHFLPSRPGEGTPLELRLISSLAGPGMQGCQCDDASYGEARPSCQFHLLADVHSFTRWTNASTGNLSLVRATHCHHYRAIPINDGLHILFVEPRTGLLCIGSDAPIGGPTSLTRALICVPPYGKDPMDSNREQRIPTVFAAGSDLSWGLRVVAAYEDRIVLYSVPLDVFNVIRRERERQGDSVMGDSDLARDWFLDVGRKRRESLAQNQSGDWDFLLSVSYRPTAMMWPLKIYGKEIGRMDQVVELALQSSTGGVRVWAFGASGETNVIDVDTFTSPARPLGDVPCKSLSVGPDGSLVSPKLIDRAELGYLPPAPSSFSSSSSSSSSPATTPSTTASRKRKQTDDRRDFGGQYTSSQQLRKIMTDCLDSSTDSEPASSASTALSVAIKRRPSFAACIVDFKIPELSVREGRWVEASA
ncbi:hypothetical protein ASPZODRAFT_74748 [Penicilliopsis zonata CBS 506.65]|uniref:F-box domain-containing protein n=1 Tax=Penicilliopsis zonata CBS 506.65 TaxID=1073090 RepID=A0A1L9S7U7_9EURO|nr:hypothetical protein ASPZODRAFT_74748 [Penicilliopsis zonata CBS 506.65]OJJ43228.1 hypothetical protein ASPZODRAFT_74748 [Penicilliopsis zonata CBS 506.65]